MQPKKTKTRIIFTFDCITKYQTGRYFKGIYTTNTFLICICHLIWYVVSNTIPFSHFKCPKMCYALTCTLSEELITL